MNVQMNFPTEVLESIQTIADLVCNPEHKAHVQTVMAFCWTAWDDPMAGELYSEIPEPLASAIDDGEIIANDHEMAHGNTWYEALVNAIEAQLANEADDDGI